MKAGYFQQSIDLVGSRSGHGCGGFRGELENHTVALLAAARETGHGMFENGDHLLLSGRLDVAIGPHRALAILSGDIPD